LKIIEVFSRFPKFTFLWKFEKEENLSVKLPENVHIASWIPQNDVLAHPKTKLFISHCGLLSTQEAFWYGVPVLGFPVFADQPQNAFRMKQLGVGEVLSILDFTENELFHTIKELIENPKYLNKAKEISAALHDLPMTPLEEATYWSEWVLRNPQIDIGSPSVNTNLFVRHSLDVIFSFLLVVILICFVAARVILIVVKFCCGKLKNVDELKKKN
jgi:glucuronosyltransferase